MTSALDERPAGTTDNAPSNTTARAWPRPDAATLTVAAAAMAAALVLSRRTGLWLDEAQSVAIARLPLRDLVHALRHDGAPPVYYVLLHGWMGLFGDGDVAVRSLSSVLAVAAVAPTVAAARRTGAGAATGVVLVTLPFFYRYGTEARMYSLVFLLVAVGWWAFVTERWALLAVATGLLLLTHYWAFFLVVPAMAIALWLRRFKAVAAVAAGGLLFLPWLGVFAYQAAHTGAPWAVPARLDLFERALRGFAGGTNRVSVLGFLAFALAVLAVRHSRAARPLAVAVAVPLALGFVVSEVTGAAFAERYAAIVFVPFCALVALGFDHVGRPSTTRAAVAGFVALGLVMSGVAVHRPRSQAPAIAAALDHRAAALDVVVFCPDQLGPGVMRLLHADVVTTAYPAGGSGATVDWVDYAERNRAADPAAFAAQVHRQAAARTVWVVASPGYRTFGRSCTRLVEELRRLRGGDERVVRLKRSSYEHASLWRFAGTGAA
jgi:hypothetical protein